LTTIGFILWLVLQGYFYVMFARLIVELVTFNNPVLRAKPLIHWVIRVTWALTEPLLKFMRRVFPNIRLGSVSIDLSWAILMLLVSIASSAVQRL
jgi:YggT family protein